MLEIPGVISKKAWGLLEIPNSSRANALWANDPKLFLGESGPGAHLRAQGPPKPSWANALEANDPKLFLGKSGPWAHLRAQGNALGANDPSESGPRAHLRAQGPPKPSWANALEANDPKLFLGESRPKAHLRAQGTPPR